jgi:predicted Zn-dependent peptidase
METTDQRLENGIRLLTGRRPETGSVLVAINVSVGSLHEREEWEEGAAHFLEHMAFKGTKTRDQLAIAREVEGQGGTINAQTSHDGTMYWVLTTPRHFQHAAELLRDVFFNSVFPEEEFEKERRVVLEELKQQDDIWVHVLWREFDKRLFHGTTRQHPICGKKESVSALSREQLLAFRGRYTNRATTVVCVGAVENASLILEELFSSMPKTEPDTFQPARATLRETKEETIESKFVQCYQFVGMEGPKDAELYATPEARIASALIGEGMSSLLFQKIRAELNLAYMVGSFVDSNLHNGAFVAHATTDPLNAELARGEILRVLQRVAEGSFEDEELTEAKERVIGPLYTHSETNSAMARHLLCTSLATGNYLSLEERERRYRAVDRAAVAAFMSAQLAKPRLELRLMPKES